MHPLSVRLSVWLGEHGFHRLHRAVALYWRARNVFLEWYEPKAFKVWKFFARKCSVHHQMPLTAGICGRCALEQAVQRVKLDRLAGRK